MQSIFLAPIVASKMKNEARKVMGRLFSTSPSLLKPCLQLVLGASTFSLVFLPLLDLVFWYYTSNKLDFPTEDYVAVMKCFAKLVLDSTVRPNYALLESCAGIFKKVTRRMFEDVLLSGMLKALLRNPDELTRG